MMPQYKKVYEYPSEYYTRTVLNKYKNIQIKDSSAPTIDLMEM